MDNELCASVIDRLAAGLRLPQYGLWKHMDSIPHVFTVWNSKAISSR
tara:strand:+ start:3258 stop:3398 length:141 start_codon:yes stop_codon:yes gene_type:complete